MGLNFKPIYDFQFFFQNAVENLIKYIFVFVLFIYSIIKEKILFYYNEFKKN